MTVCWQMAATHKLRNWYILSWWSLAVEIFYFSIWMRIFESVCIWCHNNATGFQVSRFTVIRTLLLAFCNSCKLLKIFFPSLTVRKADFCVCAEKTLIYRHHMEPIPFFDHMKTLTDHCNRTNCHWRVTNVQICLGVTAAQMGMRLSYLQPEEEVKGRRGCHQGSKMTEHSLGASGKKIAELQEQKWGGKMKRWQAVHMTSLPQPITAPGVPPDPPRFQPRGICLIGVPWLLKYLLHTSKTRAASAPFLLKTSFKICHIIIALCVWTAVCTEQPYCQKLLGSLPWLLYSSLHLGRSIRRWSVNCIYSLLSLHCNFIFTLKSDKWQIKCPLATKCRKVV